MKKYKNLIGEMAKKNIKNSEMADKLNIHPNTLANKINGNTPFMIDEAFNIKEYYFPELDLTYLFQSENINVTA